MNRVGDGLERGQGLGRGTTELERRRLSGHGGWRRRRRCCWQASGPTKTADRKATRAWFGARAWEWEDAHWWKVGKQSVGVMIYIYANWGSLRTFATIAKQGRETLHLHEVGALFGFASRSWTSTPNRGTQLIYGTHFHPRIHGPLGTRLGITSGGTKESIFGNASS